MANFIFTSNSNSVLVDIDGSQAPFTDGDLYVYTPDRSGDTVYLYEVKGVLKALGRPGNVEIYNKSKDRIPIQIGVDGIDVDGTTVFADAGALLDALRAIFFLASPDSPLIPDSQRVNTYADLPDPVANDGQYWVVDQATGTWILGTRREAGIYKAVAGVWVYRGADVPYYLLDDQFTIKDGFDNSKQLGFEVGGITPGTRRIATWPDKDLTVAEDRVTVKLIQSVDDFLRIHGANVNNEIILTFPIYEIDSENLDLGVYKLIANRDLTLKGISQGNNKIFSTEDNTDLITVNNGSLFVIQLNLESSGLNSQCIVMSGTGNEALDMQQVAFSGNSKFGTLTDIRQGFWTNGFAFNSREGFTLDGSFSGFTLFESRIINCGNFILGAGGNLSINNVRSNVNATVPTGAFAFDFDFEDFTGDGSYLIQGGRFDGDGEMLAPFTDPLSDRVEAEKSTRSFMRNNSGVKAKNTRPGIVYNLTTEVLTPLAVNTPARLLGVATYSKQEHWGNQLDNVITYLDEISADFTLFYSLLIDGGPNDVIRIDIRKYDDLVTPINFTVIASLRRTIPNLTGGLDVGSFIIPVPDIQVNFEERVEIWVTNETDGTDVTLKQGSTVFVRPS